MRVPFLEGNDRIAKILIAPLLVGLLIFVVNVLVNAWHEGPEALIGLAAIPFFPVFMMPAQAILFLMGRSQHIRTTPRVMLVLLSYVLLIGLIIWGWANNDAMA